MTDVMGEIRSLMSEPVLNTPMVRAMIGRLQRAGDVETLAYLAEALALRETPVEPLVLRLASNSQWAYRQEHVNEAVAGIRKETGRPVVCLAEGAWLEYAARPVQEVVLHDGPAPAPRFPGLVEVEAREEIEIGALVKAGPGGVVELAVLGEPTVGRVRSMRHHEGRWLATVEFWG
jgi:hypothetical protein